MNGIGCVAVVQGTRPEIIKNYSLVRALARYRIPHVVLHTNQHSAPAMAGAIYAELGYRPDATCPGSYRIGSTIDWLQKVFVAWGVTQVIVNGDTAAALAGAIAALYGDIPIIHVEAGLRARDARMLEERNRIMVDAVAELLFAYTHHEVKLLRADPNIRGTVCIEGNTTVDLIHELRPRFAPSPLAERYIFATMHRREFTERADLMRSVFATLSSIACAICPVVLPLHPRTRDAMTRHGLTMESLRPVCAIEPVGITDALSWQSGAACILTDSGCIQEESYILGTPCVTVRENTERHLTVVHGANFVCGFDGADIRAATRRAISADISCRPEIYGRPGAADRMVARMVEHFAGTRTDRDSNRFTQPRRAAAGVLNWLAREAPATDST